MSRHVAQDASKRSDFDGIVIWDGEVVLATLVGRQS